MQTAILRILHMLMTKKLKRVYSGYQFEQSIKKHTRMAITGTELGEQRLGKSLIDNFSTSSSKYFLETGVLEKRIVDHYLVYGVRKINSWRLKKTRAIS